jgi:CheY-like chemotaxis protein/HPt (histidine-containing phosphotransfer) domain-containing protein
MNGIIGMTGLLLDTGLDRVQRDYAETIRASADSLLTILNDILDFSKIEAGKLDIESLELDVRSNVDDVGSIMAFQAAAKGLELIVNVRPEVPERVMGDPQRIRQCLLNLVGNAIKFTQGGEVVIEVCALGTQNGKTLVHFEVRDTGIGIPKETLDKLFQPFTQADSSTTRRFGGTGLGLSIVRKLIEMMGGQVGAQSEIDKGSTFWFTLPLESTFAAAEEESAGAPLRGRRVLLVDDNETNRRVLTSQMAYEGCEVSAASSAEQALEILRQPGQGAFDVVLLDYHMPDMDGSMLGEQIMNSRDIPPTRLMLLTSLDRSGDMQRFADIGFAAYLTKPVRTRELIDCLQRALSYEAQDWHMHSQPIITRGTLVATEAKRKYSGRVLLVEDNAINQRVARRFLERLGCEVHVVGDGAQGVEAFQRGTYGFILMDMQMPVMDGIEATRRIRELEAGPLRTPIVALTANAMMGTLERCLEAGMDDYLTKPLDISRLEDVLDRFMGNSADRDPKPETGAPRIASADVSVRARLAEIAGDDVEFIAELIGAFLTGGEDTLRELEAAAANGDVAAMGRAAHKLKGASANLHVDGLAALTLEVETRAKAGQPADWRHDLDRIKAEFARVSAALRGEMEQMMVEQRAAG